MRKVYDISSLKIGRISLLLVAFTSLIVLSACGGKEDVEMKEFVFLEKTDEYETDRLVFESVEDQTYYYVWINGWEYDNFEDVIGFREYEKIKLEVDKINDIFLDKKYCIKLFDKCKGLYYFSDYKRK